MLTSALARRLLLILLVLALAISLVISIRQFFASTQVAYSWGDGALLEMYTIHASRGLWDLGPYSRLGWHHPGPLLFYALLPMYALSGWHAFGLNAGALTINTAALLCIAWAVARWVNPATGCAVLVAIAVYLFRVGEITISYWNPHVIVLPLGAFILLCAAVSAGRASTLPIAVMVGSFLAQTHVSLVPNVAALVSVSLVGLLANNQVRGSRSAAASSQRNGFWVAAAVVVLALLWGLPLAEEVRGNPGNLSRIVHFFAQARDGQPWTTATSAWGDAVSAVFSREFKIPTGAAMQPRNGALTPLLAAVQILLLIVAWRQATRRSDRFQASLCFIGAVASITALLSILRIRLVIGEYMVFWISILGALNWASLAAAAASRLRPTAFDARSRASRPLAVVIVTVFVIAAVLQFRRNTRQPLEEHAQTVGVLAEAVETHLKRAGSQRPLLRISPAVLIDGAGVTARLYKLGVGVTVEEVLADPFGQPLAFRGTCDAVIHIVDATTHAELARRAGDLLLASHGPVYVHADLSSGGTDAGRHSGGAVELFQTCKIHN